MGLQSCSLTRLGLCLMSPRDYPGAQPVDNTFVCPLNRQLKAAFYDVYPTEVMPILTTDALWTVVNILGALNSLDKSQP
ncbi:hypothetical protein AVEN_87725-1 [Araneus ventricosus]|uniref:Uncharacterized protein n=1 Tax=Araneus ventricosus TaxID=182803 RepID=A0A4Y2NW31_ARAVE|nr:hypothetical protein AVEN_87725-1 [Araneus ventricosus]